MTCIADSDQRAPQTIGSRMALLLAFVSGAAVANVYYAQPLLDDLGAQLQMSPAALGWVTTATQGGYLLGLVMVVPLATGSTGAASSSFSWPSRPSDWSAPPRHRRHGRSSSSLRSSVRRPRWFK